MGKLVLATALIALAFSADTIPRTYEINLDLDPAERFVEVFKDFEGPLKTLVETTVNQLSWYEYYGMAYLLRWTFLDADVASEIFGATSAIGIDYNAAVILNFMYELKASCTSVVIRQWNGKIVHGRNLDFSYTSLFRDLTVQFEYKRAGQLQYTATGLVGCFGVITGMKHGGFSISIDERDSGSFFGNLYDAVVGYEGNVFVIRKAFEQYDTYEDAKEYLTNVYTVADAYYIIAGLNGNEGAVITHDRKGAGDVWELSLDDWLLVETNYDHWLPAPEKDNRRDLVENMINDIGQFYMNSNTLFDVLSTPPALNNSTIYTVIMEPFSGISTPVIRHYPEVQLSQPKPENMQLVFE